MTARLAVDPSQPDGETINLRARITDPTNVSVIAEQQVRVGWPWPALRAEVYPPEVLPGEVVTYTLSLANLGMQPDNIYLTQVITAGLEVLTTTVDANIGKPVLEEETLIWEGDLPAGAELVITYQARVTRPVGGVRLEGPVEVFASHDYRMQPLYLVVLSRIFLPFFDR